MNLKTAIKMRRWLVCLDGVPVPEGMDVSMGLLGEWCGEFSFDERVWYLEWFLYGDGGNTVDELTAWLRSWSGT